MPCPKSSNCLSNDPLLRKNFFFPSGISFPKEFKRSLLGKLSNNDTLTQTHFAGCNKYGNLCRSSNSALSAAGKTRLDRERAKMCQHEMVREKRKLGETFPSSPCGTMCVKISAKIALQNIASEAKNIASEAKFVFEFDCFSREKFSVTF